MQEVPSYPIILNYLIVKKIGNYINVSVVLMYSGISIVNVLLVGFSVASYVYSCEPSRRNPLTKQMFGSYIQHEGF